MAIDVYASFDMHQNVISEFAIQSGAAFPATPVLGQHFILTPGNVESYWNGTVWVALGNGPYKFAQTIGNGVLLTFVVNHNLGTQDTIESLYSVSAPFAEQIAVVQHTDANNTTFIFTIPPALNSVRAVIHA
jgi:hypothetical protein